MICMSLNVLCVGSCDWVYKGLAVIDWKIDRFTISQCSYVHPPLVCDDGGPLGERVTWEEELGDTMIAFVQALEWVLLLSFSPGIPKTHFLLVHVPPNLPLPEQRNNETGNR